MSLVNNMLRDLDRRQRGQARPLPAEVVPTDVSKRQWLRSFTLVAVLVVVGGGALFTYLRFFELRNSRMPQPVVIAEASAPAMPIAAADQQGAPTVASGLDTAQPVAASAPAAVPVAPREREPAQLVAATAVAATAVAAPSPAIDMAAAPLHQGQSVSQPPAAAAKARRRSRSTTSQFGQGGSSAPSSEPAQTKSMQPSPSVASASETPSVLKIEIASPTPRDVQSAKLQMAAELRSRGEHRQAEELLRAALAQDATHPGARLALAALLAETGRHEEAVAELRSGHALTPANPAWTHMLVQTLSQRGDWSAAAMAAEQAPPSLQADANFRAMRAAISQRLGRYDESIEHYQFSLRAAPHVGAWWIGLALSLEGAGRLGDAREAYVHARARTALNGPLLQFAEDKIARLP